MDVSCLTPALAADKTYVERTQPEVFSALPRWNLVSDLRGSMRRMMARGHRPGSFLLARLTDGRIKLVELDGRPEEAPSRLALLKNEHGPVNLAVVVSVNFSGGEWVITAEEPASAHPPVDRTRPPARLLRGVPLLGD